MARLILSLDNRTLAEYNMNRERYTIGRLPDNDVRIDNPTVSGHHSLIINILNDSFLEDLNSTNGTYVNGKLIKKHALQHGDVITVGKHQLRYVESSSIAQEERDEFAATMVIDNAEMVAGHAAAMAAAAVAAEPAPQAAAAAAHLVDTVAGAKPLPVAKVQVLSGSFAGRQVALNKAVTTLGRPGESVEESRSQSLGHPLTVVADFKQDVASGI